MAPWRVGLIGLGEVAQVVHLPVLSELGDQFEVVAGCDVDQDFAETVCARHGVPKAYASVHAMLANENLDAVAILNSDEFHCEATVAALKGGCHVLLEKPASLSPGEVEEMIAARDASGREVMVGYMRRHAGAYLELRKVVSKANNIRHVSIRDIVGPNSYFIGQVAKVLRPKNLSQQVKAQKAVKADALVREVLGDASPLTRRSFRLLCSLSSHDVSAMRGLVGTPRRVAAARATQNGDFISVLFEFDGFTATFETGLDQTGVFDAYIEVFADEGRYRIDYDTPYIRHLPTNLSVTTTDGERTRTETIRPTFRDPYTNEWLEFAACLGGEQPVSSTLEDASEDVRLMVEIARMIEKQL